MLTRFTKALVPTVLATKVSAIQVHFPQFTQKSNPCLMVHMLYATPVWWDFTGEDDQNRLRSIMGRLIRPQYLPVDNPTLDQICLDIDTSLFCAVLGNQSHVLYGFLPLSNRSPIPYAQHYHLISQADNFTHRTFIIRML